MSELSPITLLREFKGHKDWVKAVAVFPDKRRMVTSSNDKILRLWDLETGVVLKNMEGHRYGVRGLTVSRDGRFIASKLIHAHSKWVASLNFSPDGTVLATGSYDETTKLWNTKTWEGQGN